MDTERKMEAERLCMLSGEFLVHIATPPFVCLLCRRFLWGQVSVHVSVKAVC